MPELEILEAKLPRRTSGAVVMASTMPAAPTAPVRTGGWLSGPVFSRARDIFAANMAELIDRSEEPGKMIRVIIIEMEETLVDLRAAAARSIADVKEMRRAIGRLETMQEAWTARAELALDKGREDLARQALEEREQAASMAAGLERECGEAEGVLRGLEADIAKLQSKLREARARQNSIASRFESALSRARAHEAMSGSRAAEAFAKFELLERRADFAEGRADALALTGPRSLEEEIADLRAAQQVDADLAAMKARLAARNVGKDEQHG